MHRITKAAQGIPACWGAAPQRGFRVWDVWRMGCVDGSPAEVPAPSMQHCGRAAEGAGGRGKMSCSPFTPHTHTPTALAGHSGELSGSFNWGGDQVTWVGALSACPPLFPAASPSLPAPSLPPCRRCCPLPAGCMPLRGLGQAANQCLCCAGVEQLALLCHHCFPAPLQAVRPGAVTWDPICVLHEIGHNFNSVS